MALYFMPKYVKTDKNFPVLDMPDLNASSSLSEQIKRITTFLEMPPEELKSRQAACEEILQMLRKFYPEASFLMYGSSVNSFGIKGCDMDLLFTPFKNYSNVESMVIDGDEVTIPDPASVLSGEVSKDVLAKFNEPSHLKFVRNILRREKIGKKSNMITFMNRPFLRVFLKNYNFVCTMSASNKLVALNSELLQFYGKLDERVKPLVICLEYWARSLGFIKPSFFSYDSFALLIIFFLQSVNPPILPSVQRLMDISKSSRKIAGWETTFCANVRSVPKSRNTQSVDELFTQFFDFYFHFDFLRNAVCPRSGRPLPIKDIKNSRDARMADFKIKSMNIQDPFVLSSNVVAVERLDIFKLALLTASEVLKGKGKIIIPAFFNPDAYQHVLDIHYRRYISGKPQVSFIHYDYDCNLKFGNLQMFYDKASEAVYDVLQYGLLMECEVTDKVDSIMAKGRADSVNGKKDDLLLRGRSKDVPMQTSISDQNVKPSTPYDLQLLLSIQCLMYSRSYMGRKNVEVSSLDSPNDSEEPADSVLGIEHRISKSVIDKNSLLKSTSPSLVFNCECYRHVNSELTDLIVVLKPLMVSKEFKQVSEFLAAFLPKVVKKILISN